ncbi:MAG: T9SS type A sorting domain-containing protein [Bacteroidia bacterium]|nr:T9SS type A sorting domain-containing protein [Bacteroidia bacterium]
MADISCGQSLVGAVAFKGGYRHTPSGSCVNNRGEIFYSSMEWFSDSVLLSVSKYSSDLVKKEWTATWRCDTAVKWYFLRTFCDNVGDLYLLYSKNLKTNPELKTYVYKLNRETGDTTRIITLDGSLGEAKFVSSGQLYLLEWLTSDLPSAVYLMKIDLNGFKITWQRKINFSVSGLFSFIEEGDGVRLFNYFHSAPRVDDNFIEGKNIAGPLSIHFSSEGQATLKPIAPFCCEYGFGEVIINPYGDYYTLAAVYRTTIFGNDTIKAGLNYLGSGLLGIEGSSGFVKKAAGITPYQYYSFGNIIWDKKGILGSYSSATRSYWPGTTRLALVDPWDLKEIWSKKMPGFIMDLLPDGQGNLFVIGDFDNSINFEGQIFETKGRGYYISKYDINKLELPEGPEKIGTASVFPNPFDDELTIYFDRKVKSLTIKVFNSLGQVHSEYTGIKSRLKLDTESWDNGTYYLQIKEEGEALVTKKILKVAKE